MDMICPICAEPVENDYLHEIAEEKNSSYKKIASSFRSVGCEAIDNTHNERTKGNTKSHAAAAMYDLLGDDMDGAAAMMEDFDLSY